VIRIATADSRGKEGNPARQDARIQLYAVLCGVSDTADLPQCRSEASWPAEDISSQVERPCGFSPVQYVL
jgi:hypothetical protein